MPKRGMSSEDKFDQVSALTGGGRRVIRKTFAHHRPTEAGQKKLRQLRELFSKFHDELDLLLPAPSREKSCAITNIETAAMWACKALICNDPESVVET